MTANSKPSTNNMVIRATLQTKLACAALLIIITNICILIAVIAYISMEEMCKTESVDTYNKTVADAIRAHPYRHELQTTIGKHPWMLAFIVLPDNIFIGGAIIIGQKWALTTADCVEKVSDYPISKKGFRGGSTSWNVNGYYHYAVKIIPHENFDPYTLDCNVALIQVARPFTYTNEVPIFISGTHFMFSEETAMVTGWTILLDTDNVYEYLINAKVSLISQQVCNKTLARIKNVSISSTSLCTKRKGKRNVTGCHFTSGSALVTNKNLIGLVSWGVMCNETQWPGVYVYLEQMLNWIMEIKTKEDTVSKLV